MINYKSLTSNVFSHILICYNFQSLVSPVNCPRVLFHFRTLDFVSDLRFSILSTHFQHTLHFRHVFNTFSTHFQQIFNRVFTACKWMISDVGLVTMYELSLHMSHGADRKRLRPGSRRNCAPESPGLCRFPWARYPPKLVLPDHKNGE